MNYVLDIALTHIRSRVRQTIVGVLGVATGVGFSVFVESVRQLQGKAGKAQVEGARYLVEDCGGGAFMDVHFTVLGNQIPN